SLVIRVLYSFPTRRSSDLCPIKVKLMFTPVNPYSGKLLALGNPDSGLRLGKAFRIKRESEQLRTECTWQYLHRSSEQRRADRRSGTFYLAALAPIPVDVQNLPAICRPE